MANDVFIQLKNLTKEYALGGVRSTVLKAVSLDVQQGELLAIVGASGSGKSTLMNIIGFLDHADSGEYYFRGQHTATLDEDALAELRNRCIGFVFQQFNLLPRFTAEQNVALPLMYRHPVLKDIDERVKRSLDRVGMLPFLNHRPTQLSGGQQQRVAIARALVSDPAVILADEPTGALDVETGGEVMNLFHRFHKEGCTIIIVTHDERIASQCTRRIMLSNNQIIDVNTP